ncbi:hypothetical protein VTO42DRAFT_2543 [Malbranchea cinnamomea]
MENNRPPWSRASTHREFIRAYKACIPCRIRKAKCELGGNAERGIPPGPPCMRCRREQRKCEFTETRAWARKKKSDASNAAETAQKGSLTTSSSHDVGVTGPIDTSRSLHLSASYQQPTSSIGGDVNTSPQPSYLLTNHSPHPTPMTNNSNIDRNPSETAVTSVNEFSSVETTSQMCSTPGRLRSPGIVQERKNSSGLANSVMRTVVSSGNDALNILFQAAEASNMNDLATAARSPTVHNSPSIHSGQQLYGDPGSMASFGTAPTVSECLTISTVEPEVLRVWEACRFVKLGWFTAVQAVTYIDLFFKHMAPLSPIISNFYVDHRNHYWLITQEPVLCCTILMISSRYHILPGAGGASRAFFIHQSLWQHCQHLIMRVMLGQEKGSRAKTRTLGTIEALLLMSEWHPRSLHFPPESDLWDSDLMVAPPDSNKSSKEATTSASNTWLEEVIEPARRSDRMSWMLLGSGLTLAHELGVFDADDSRARSLISCPEIDSKTVDINQRRQRIQQLLYVFINQLASRLGCMSLMPQSLNHCVLAPLSSSQRTPASVDEWSSFITSWIELTKLVKSVTDMAFPSAALTRHQLHSGRYIGLLDHFRPLLSQWREKYLDSQSLSPFHDMIFIEYQYARVYTNSIGMQAAVERILAESDPESAGDDIRQANVDEIDYEFIQEVIDGSCNLLQKVVELSEAGRLRFSPVRIFIRITSSSIFLIKALGLGVRNSKLQESLDILTRSIHALRSNALDDIHLSSRYATLLEVLVARLRRSFLLNNKPSKASRGTTRVSSVRPPPAVQNGRQMDQTAVDTEMNEEQDMGNNNNRDVSNPDMAEDPIRTLNDINADDWLSLPFDPSMAPFGASGGNQVWSGMDGVNLNFIWNLGS